MSRKPAWAFKPHKSNNQAKLQRSLDRNQEKHEKGKGLEMCQLSNLKICQSLKHFVCKPAGRCNHHHTQFELDCITYSRNYNKQRDFTGKPCSQDAQARKTSVIPFKYIMPVTEAFCEWSRCRYHMLSEPDQTTQETTSRWIWQKNQWPH